MCTLAEGVRRAAPIGQGEAPRLQKEGAMASKNGASGPSDPQKAGASAEDLLMALRRERKEFEIYYSAQYRKLTREARIESNIALHEALNN